MDEAATPQARRAPTRGSGAGPAAWPAHPFLIAAASVFSLYAANLRETTLADALSALAAALALAFVLFAAFGVALRRFGPRAAVLASVVLIGALYYTPLTIWLNRFVGAVHPE